MELGDVESQLQASRPIITFMDSIIRMSDLYAGNDAMFASEYKKVNLIDLIYFECRDHIIEILALLTHINLVTWITHSDLFN